MKIKDILDYEKNYIAPDEGVVLNIKTELKKFIDSLKKSIQHAKVDAQVFIGGSYAKGTMIKSPEYDVDVFIRFNKKYNNQISEVMGKIVGNLNYKSVKVHGSRDYFQFEIERGVKFELIPILKITNPKDAENSTDLSYFHVSYVKNKLAYNKKLAGEIRLAKAFCHAQGCYGAESYVNGFSGYGLELLVLHYNGFEKFLRQLLASKDKIVIFDKKDFKNKQEVLMNLNQSKLRSPIIYSDPTYKERNVLAALSNETFSRFKDAAKSFLKRPSKDFFVKKKFDVDFFKRKALKNKSLFSSGLLATNRQAGDIAGSKLLKLFNHLNEEASKFFDIKDKGFEYNGKDKASFYFSAKPKKEIILSGPPIDKKEHATQFKKMHKNSFVKDGRLYARHNAKKSLKEFLEDWKKQNHKTIKEMAIVKLDLYS